MREWITYPYLSVKFKRNGESEDVAVRQVCAADAITLFNQYYLHAEAQEAASKGPARSGLGDADKGEMAAIRHYAPDFYRPQICLLNSTTDLGRAGPVGWLRHKETVWSRLR